MAAKFVLPTAIVSPIDLNQVIRELQAADEVLQQAGLRKGGEAVKLPRVERLLNEVAEANKTNLLVAEDRQLLLAFLTKLKDQAPVMHISFNADPSVAFLQKLITWIRQELHPLALVRVGLLPTIGAGCVLRTTNQVFDFSLRQQFDKQQQILIDSLKQLGSQAKT